MGSALQLVLRRSVLWGSDINMQKLGGESTPSPWQGEPVVGLDPMDYWARKSAGHSQAHWDLLHEDISGLVKHLLILSIFLLITIVYYVTKDFYLNPDKETEKEVK